MSGIQIRGGNVLVETGNIISSMVVSNSANANFATVNCNCITPAPSCPFDSSGAIDTAINDAEYNTTPNTSTNTSIGGGSPGQVLAASVGPLLPATGSYWMFLNFRKFAVILNGVVPANAFGLFATGLCDITRSSSFPLDSYEEKSHNTKAN